MSNHRISSPSLVYHRAGFAAMLAHLADQPLVALDTESDSLFSYYPKVCLIQVTTYTETYTESDAAGRTDDNPAVTDYLIDPLRYNELDGLRDLLADPQRQVILHAAENDILLLQRAFGFTFPNLFDTQLAARILGWKRAGLAAILEDQLHARGRWEEAQEAFAQLSTLDYVARPANSRDFWQMKETRRVPLAITGVLEALWLWREQEAQRQDRPPFKVVSNAALVELAERRPATLAQLHEVRALSVSEIQRYGSAILAALAEGKQRPLPPLPEPTLRPEQILDRPTLERYDALRRWSGDVADARGVAPDIILTNEVLLTIAKQQPRSPEELARIAGLGPWKLRTYGPDLLRIAAR